MRRREFLLIVGGAVWPSGAGAQPAIKGTRRIAIVSVRGPVGTISEESSSTWRAFFTELRRRGYAEGNNLVVDRAAIDTGYKNVPSPINELIQRAPEVIVVDASHWARGINAVKGTIPIVALVSNPLGEDLSSSLAAPGSSITGIATDTGPALLGKQFDLLLEAAPHSRHVACFGAIWPSAGMRRLWSDARQRGVSVQEFVVHAQFRQSSRAYADAFSALLRDGADAVLVLNDPEHLSDPDAIAELGLRHRVPLISPFRTLTEAGGLMSYGPNWDELERRRAVYVARILDGATPQELPFEQPSRFEFVVNLKTARALGIEIPPTLLARADEVIE
jgi:ABC-type uncharacterized transport system substrate-binding protein